MCFFRFFKRTDINEGVIQYKNTENALLIDVREIGEYKDGHIPGSVNIPLSTIENSINGDFPQLKNKEQPLFVYCLSGARSTEAVARLVKQGFSCVNNIGGISSYTGEIEK